MNATKTLFFCDIDGDPFPINLGDFEVREDGFLVGCQVTYPDELWDDILQNWGKYDCADHGEAG